MSLELERAAIAKHFNDVGWDPAWGNREVYIAWPNKPFVTPNDHMFVVFNLVSRGTIRRSLGLSYFKRHLGTMQIDIYTPQDQGTKLSREMSDALELIYDTITLPLNDGEAVVFQTPSSRQLDPNVIRAANLDNNWDRYVVEAPYYRDIHVEK